MADLTWTNTWLGILAVISLIQFLIVCAAGLFAYRMYQKAMTTIETVERVHIAPLRARVDGMLDQVQLMTDKVRHAQESVSDALQARHWHRQLRSPAPSNRRRGRSSGSFRG